MLDQLAARFTHIITLEDNVVTGGFGGAVAEHFAAKDYTHIRLKLHGIPDRFVDHGTPAELAKELGLDPAGIADVTKAFLEEKTKPATRGSGMFVS